MGALLKMLGREPQALATIQAPSADLIRPDNELIPPRSKEIELELEPEKLADYSQASNAWGIANQAIQREKLLHFLKNEDFKIYDWDSVFAFMKKSVDYAFNNLKLADDLWWYWIELEKYRHPFPPRIVEEIKKIYSYNQQLKFSVSDLIRVKKRYGSKNTGVEIAEWGYITMKRKTEVCFLKVDPTNDCLAKEPIIIDAWRGPTFSDEEAKI